MARIKTTPMVRFALWALRIYLLILLVLIGIKFARVFSSSHQPDQTPGPAAELTTDYTDNTDKHKQDPAGTSPAAAVETKR